MKGWIDYFTIQAQKLTELLYRVLVPGLRQREAEIVRKSEESIRIAVQLNQYTNQIKEKNSELEDLIKQLKTENQRLSEENYRTTKGWSQEYDLCRKLVRGLPTRILEIRRRVDKSKTPRIWANLDGIIEITNLPDRFSLIGKKLNDYLIENQYPDTGTRDHNQIIGITTGKRVYKLKNISNSVEGEIKIGTMVRLEKVKARNLQDSKEVLMELIQNQVERMKIKPQKM
ncbi:MAG: hypothetical protein AABW56_01105 [Nanoarchaeota archaeon]